MRIKKNFGNVLYLSSPPPQSALSQHLMLNLNLKLRITVTTEAHPGPASTSAKMRKFVSTADAFESIFHR